MIHSVLKKFDNRFHFTKNKFVAPERLYELVNLNKDSFFIEFLYDKKKKGYFLAIMFHFVQMTHKSGVFYKNDFTMLNLKNLNISIQYGDVDCLTIDTCKIFLLPGTLSLHREDGPAMMSDRYSLYAYNGVVYSNETQWYLAKNNLEILT